VKGPRSVGSTGLQIDEQAPIVSKGAEHGFIGSRRWLQNTKHEHVRRFTDRQLDLRQPLSDREPSDQLS
jgi:hypothetical protein